MVKNKKIFTPNVYNQWLALFRKDWEEKNDKKKKKARNGTDGQGYQTTNTRRIGMIYLEIETWFEPKRAL